MLIDRVLDIDPLDRLAARIREQEALVAVVGLGYVGLPLIVGIHGAGFDVLGVDADDHKIAGLVARRSHVVDILDSRSRPWIVPRSPPSPKRSATRT